MYRAAGRILWTHRRTAGGHAARFNAIRHSANGRSARSLAKSAAGGRVAPGDCLVQRVRMNDEQKRLDRIASWYLGEQLDFDRRMVRFRYEALRPHLKGPTALELGSAEGEMTRFLLPHFEHLVIVDAAGELLDRIPDSPHLTKVHCLFESFQPQERFDTIVMEHVLEHVAEPVALLRKARGCLA